jgi:hypothetical protein
MREEAIKPAERGYSDSAPAKEEESLSLAPAPRVVRALWPDYFCLLGALLVPPLTTSGYLVLWWLLGAVGFGESGFLVGAAGVSLGACCMWPLLRAPRAARATLLWVYVVLVSVVVLFLHFMVVMFARFLSGLNRI